MRIRGAFTTIIGAGTALLLGTGMISLVSDSITSEGNRVASPELVNSTDLVLAQATESRPGSFTCGTYTDETVGPMRWGSDPLDVQGTLSEEAVVTPRTAWCLKNAGREAFHLRMLFENVISTEVSCGPREAEVDETCSPGAPGELDRRTSQIDSLGPLLVQVFIDGQAGRRAAFACWTGACSSPALPNPYFDIADLDPGESIVVRLAFDWEPGNGSIDWQKQSQTDRLQWDVNFTAYSTLA